MPELKLVGFDARTKIITLEIEGGTHSGKFIKLLPGKFVQFLKAVRGFDGKLEINVSDAHLEAEENNIEENSN